MRAKFFGSQTSRASAGTLAAFVLLLITGFLLPHPVAAQVKEVRRVLILNETGTSFPGSNLTNSGITSSLENSPYQIEFYREYLETALFSDPADQQQFRASFLAKYRNRKPDVIITNGPSPLRLMAETHETSFPGVPVIFALPNSGAPGSPTLDSHFSGVQDAIQAAGTVDLALRLQPGSQHVVVVGGTAAFDKQVEAVVRGQLRPYENRLDVSYLTNMAMPALLEQLKHLPDHTIVLFVSFVQDAAGTHFISGSQAAPMVVSAANAPVFSLYDVHLNHGEVGGRVSSLVRDGEIAGHMALRALNGEKTQDISVVTSPTVDLFDWRALQRWGLKESNLPTGSTVLYRQPTFWQAYRWYIIAAIALIVLQAFLIFGLLWQRSRLREAEAERRQAEQFVRESEARFQLAMSRKLLEAQEQERTRIARELHDDISQQLALLSVEIQQMKERPPASDKELRNQLDALEKQASEISDDIQSLSHELHSSKLEYLGLALAMRSFCKEFADKHKATIDFDSEGVPSVVPQEVALCLFRVAQEGLRNALKHSGVQSFEVKLHGSPTEIRLTVRDSGVGFEPELVKDAQGLGLVSMQERVRLVNGTISITSSPQSGTEIEVCVPLSAGATTEQTMSAGTGGLGDS